ncbi:MAG TPA: hypothetical protein PLW65_11975, partial [Pseudomonadota bacterium]|nr:hypothetical protein [Pseudomonadota bacterium]
MVHKLDLATIFLLIFIRKYFHQTKTVKPLSHRSLTSVSSGQGGVAPTRCSVLNMRPRALKKCKDKTMQSDQEVSGSSFDTVRLLHALDALEKGDF